MAGTGWQETYLNRYYHGRAGWQDGTSEFHEMCRRWIPAGGEILEIGAGPTNNTTKFLATLGPVHGLDPDPDVATNAALTSASVLSGDRFPFDDGRFSSAVSDYVLEHVENPAAHLREVARVLRPGAPYLFRTPNRFHYVGLISSVTPHAFHELVANRLRHSAADAHDPYPTFYRFNSGPAVRRAARDAGLQCEELRFVEKEPSYGMFSPLIFRVFMAYERVVNSTDLLESLRANLFGVLKKA